MTAVPREIARKVPANAPVRREPKTIEGRVVRKLGVGRLIGWFLFLLAVIAFAGFVISSVQQYA